MSLMPFKGRCIHCGHDHGNGDFYGDDPIRYQERLRAQAMLEKVAVYVLEKQIAALTRQRDLAVEALEKQGHSAGCRKNAFGDICTCGLDDLLSTIKEIEAMAKGEHG